MTPRVRLLGPPRVEGGGPPSRPPRGLKSWAVLARVALAERPVGRRELAGELFGEADDPLGALRWCLADLRRSLAMPGLLRGDPLAVSTGELWLDVRALRDGSLPAGDLGGDLLEGIDLQNCPGFDTWLMLARLHCAARVREELRRHALSLLAAGDAEAAIAAAGQGARLDPLDEGAQELFLRALVAAGRGTLAAAHLASCQMTFAREGLVPSPALRSAAGQPGRAPGSRLRGSVVAAALLQAGTAALDAGATDAGVETLRRAAQEADRAADPAVQADVLRALGSALVHAVRGSDGEGAVALHRALRAARTAGKPALVADILRELAFVDVQAGRHASADRALAEASREAAGGGPALISGILAMRGMNEADRGRHGAAAALLAQSADLARQAGRGRQEAWSQGVLARSLLLAGEVQPARAAAERSIAVAQRERWNAFLPWPGVLRAQCLAEAGRWTRRARMPSTRSRWPVSLATHAGRAWPAGRSGCWRCEPATCPAPSPGSPMPGAAATGCRTGTCGSPRTSAWRSWRQPPARTRAWSALRRPGSSSMRCAATCPSSSPGRWSTRPRPGTAPRSRWPGPRLAA